MQPAQSTLRTLSFMKTLTAIFLLIFFAHAHAEMCFTAPETYPRQDVKLRETYIRVMPQPTLGGSAIVLGWPTVTQGQICCNVSHFDPGSYSSMLVAAQRPAAIPASEFAVSLPALPWSNRAMETLWAVQACQEMVVTMTAAGVVVPYRVVRNPSRTDGARPMFTLVNGAMANLRINGVQVYVEPGRICDGAPVVSRTTAGLWLYTINLAGVRGITLCK